jgi:hypothetical protein
MLATSGRESFCKLLQTRHQKEAFRNQVWLRYQSPVLAGCYALIIYPYCTFTQQVTVASSTYSMGCQAV